MSGRRGLVADLVVPHGGRTNLRPIDMPAASRPLADPTHYGFGLACIAIILAFTLPSNLMVNLGLYSETPGGNVLTKFQPYTYVAILAGGFALYGRRGNGGLTGLFHDTPALAWATLLFVLCAVYSVISVGVNGVTVYVETYLSATLVAIAATTGTARQSRVLGYMILTLAVINVLISVVEGHLEEHFLPLPPGLQTNYDLGIDEFRGQAFYEHPLTGSLATSLALFLLIGMRLRAWLAVPIFCILVVGLMSFGGRTALVVTILIIVLSSLVRLGIGVITRRLNLGFLAIVIGGAILLPLLFVALITATDIGMRIMSHLYQDDSADVRIIQWRILDMLNLGNVLYGVSPAQVELMKAQIGLAEPGMDIENFGLLMFLNLGLIGFPIFVIALGLFALHLGRHTSMSAGWLMIVATILICFSSNSLGRKVPDLVFLTAFMMAMRGFGMKQREPITASRSTGPTNLATALTPYAQSRPRGLADRQPMVVASLRGT